MSQNGFGFVIAAAQTREGETLMVASRCVRDITINEAYNHPEMFGDPYRQPYRPLRSPDMTITASVAGGHEESLVHLRVEQGGYAEAWRRLFDLWVPPQFTDETKSQILTHYTFGAQQ